jgi:hypothetical protein
VESLTRFEDVDVADVDFFTNIRNKYFPELVNAKFKLVFDKKKRISDGKLTLARIQKTNDILRHLSRSEVNNPEGLDYIVYIDELMWLNIEEIDKERVLRHELRHTNLDVESEKNPYKLRGHTIEDFPEEIELNKDDINWRERVALMLESLYEKEKEDKK